MVRRIEDLVGKVSGPKPVGSADPAPGPAPGPAPAMDPGAETPVAGPLAPAGRKADTLLPAEDAVSIYLRRNPDFLGQFLDQNPDMLQSIPLGTRSQSVGNVVDLRDFMVERLRDETERLRGRLQELITTSRSNMTAQSRAHSAVLSLLAANTFEELIEIVTGDLAVILDVDVVTLCVEADGDTLPRSRMPGVLILEPGYIDSLIGSHRDFMLTARCCGEPMVFGQGAGLVRSQALIRLSVSPHAPLAMLAIGSRRDTQFEDGQGTELLGFLGAALELTIRAWLEF